MKKQAYSYSTLPSVYRRAMTKTKRLCTTTSKVIHAFLEGYVADEPEVGEHTSKQDPAGIPVSEDPVVASVTVESEQPLSSQAELLSETNGPSPADITLATPRSVSDAMPPVKVTKVKAAKPASASSSHRAGAGKKAATKPQRQGGTRLNKSKKGAANSRRKIR